MFIVLALAITAVLADVSHLGTVLHEDGYHYDKPEKSFPVRRFRMFSTGHILIISFYIFIASTKYVNVVNQSLNLSHN